MHQKPSRLHWNKLKCIDFCRILCESNIYSRLWLLLNFIEILISGFFFDTITIRFRYCRLFDAFLIHIKKFGRNYLFGPFFLHFFIFILLHMSILIVATAEHYPGKVSQRATTVMSKIKTKFHVLGLNERAANCPFKQFFLAPDVKFSTVLIN